MNNYMMILETATSIKTWLEAVISTNDEGQGMVEYGLLVALISIAAIAVIVLMGGGLVNTFQNVVNAV